jgi:ribose transport system substrate-binding protein
MRAGNLLASVLAGAAAWSALAGCGKEQSGSGAAPSAGPPRATSAGQSPAKVTADQAATVSKDVLDKVEKAKKPYHLVLIVKTRNNPFFDPMIKAFEAECKTLGATGEVQAPPQEGDKELQFNYVTNVTAKGADAILIAPADSKGIIPALKKAQEKGILVVNIDNRIDRTAAKEQGLDLAGYVGADNEAGGKLAGEFMTKALHGKGKVVIIGGLAGADNAEARRRGFEAGVKGGPQVLDVQTADWDTSKANQKVQSELAAQPDLGGIFCANDMMAIGAIKAAKQAGKTGKLTIIGYDNIPAVQPYLASKELAATIEQHPDLMGKYGVRMAVGILDGSITKGKEYLVPLEVITK